ncbi:hypothetical protein T4D_10773 [Trichinella pseudospiralis]|uniref:Uncharacterized protein n=1 Tax=Trichinella pseudospiralis TaxID=6337 RepID=A0A0V1DPY2_TRIPS|nr:hypothetical protein T4D_10773 [Trichinella pseudospiralis]
MKWLDRIVRSSTEVSVDKLEKTRFAEVERNKRPILHYFITMMIM